MPDDFDPNDILVMSIDSMIRAMGASVAEASRELMETQLAALENLPPEMAKWGLQPVIYHMQNVEVELRLAFHLVNEEHADPAGADRGLKRWWKQLKGAPINAGYTKGESFDMRGSSTLRMNFAPGPPPPKEEDDG